MLPKFGLSIWLNFALLVIVSNAQYASKGRLVNQLNRPLLLQRIPVQNELQTNSEDLKIIDNETNVSLPRITSQSSLNDAGYVENSLQTTELPVSNSGLGFANSFKKNTYRQQYQIVPEQTKQILLKPATYATNANAQSPPLIDRMPLVSDQFNKQYLNAALYGGSRPVLVTTQQDDKLDDVFELEPDYDDNTETQSLQTFQTDKQTSAVNQVYQDNSSPINLAIHRQHSVQLLDTPSSVENLAKPITVEIGPGPGIPLAIRFKTSSSTLKVLQQHQPTKGTYSVSHSEEEPHRLLHTVHRPIYQEVREVIQPFRKVTQEIKPVQEQIETIVAKQSSITQKTVQGSKPSITLNKPTETISTFQNNVPTHSKLISKPYSRIPESFQQRQSQIVQDSSFNYSPVISTQKLLAVNKHSQIGEYTNDLPSVSTPQTQQISNENVHFTDDDQSTGTVLVDRVGNGVAYKMITFTMGSDAMKKNNPDDYKKPEGYYRSRSSTLADTADSGTLHLEQPQVSQTQIGLVSDAEQQTSKQYPGYVSTLGQVKLSYSSS